MKRSCLVGLGFVALAGLIQGCTASNTSQDDNTVSNESAVRVDAKLHYNYSISYYEDKSFEARLDPSNHPATGIVEIKKNAGPDGTHYGIKLSVVGMGGPRPYQLFDLETGEFAVQGSSTTPPPDQGSNVFEYIKLVTRLKDFVAQIAAGSAHVYPGPPENPNPELNETAAYLNSVIDEVSKAANVNGVMVEDGGVTSTGSSAKVNVQYRATNDAVIWTQACKGPNCFAAKTTPVKGGQGGTIAVDYDVPQDAYDRWLTFTAKLLPVGGDPSKPIASNSVDKGVWPAERFVCLRHNYFFEPQDPKMRLTLDWTSTELRDIRIDVFDRDTQTWLWGMQEPLPTLTGEWNRKALDFELRPDLTVRAKLLPRGGTWQQAIQDRECL